jgi:hypothetical protein
LKGRFVPTARGCYSARADVVGLGSDDADEQVPHGCEISRNILVFPQRPQSGLNRVPSQVHKKVHKAVELTEFARRRIGRVDFYQPYQAPARSKPAKKDTIE